MLNADTDTMPIEALDLKARDLEAPVSNPRLEKKSSRKFADNIRYRYNADRSTRA